KSFGNTTSGWGSGQSLDQYLVGRLQPNTTFPSLQVGVHVRDTEVRARISYAGADMPIPPREDPQDVFATLFGMSSGSGTPDPALMRLWAQRKSVFDANIAETERIKTLVGKSDQDKLDAHLTAMRDVEKRLVGMTGTGSGAGGLTCTKPTMPAVV